MLLLHPGNRNDLSRNFIYWMMTYGSYTNPWKAVNKKNEFEVWKKQLFLEFVVLVVRDNVDPISLHKALMPLRQYRDGLPDDMLNHVDFKKYFQERCNEK